MSEYYHQFLSSMAGAGGQSMGNQPESSPPIPHHQTMPMAGPHLTNPYQSLGYFTGFPEPIMFNAPKAQRSRRKSAPGLDHIKHRRTRSGCYTCRSRRVKCDEVRPICERCRKGKRECNYPEPTPAKGSSSLGSRDSSGQSQQTSPDSSHGGDDDEDAGLESNLDPILDEEEDDLEPQSATTQTSMPLFSPRRTSTASSFGLQRISTGMRQEPEALSPDGNNSSSPSATALKASITGPTTPGLSGTFSSSPHARPDWSTFPTDVQFYLNYFYDNINHYHYCMVNDADDFFRSILLGIAVQNEGLLYAIVGFSAYHYMLKSPNGRIKDFLHYYNRSVSLLLAFLKSKERNNIATLLTILQLATIEEYLGDWVNLMGHQRAAFEVLTQLFTPQTVMQSPASRMILTWYARFDVFIGIMGSCKTSLTREWFATNVEYYVSKAAEEPGNLSWKIESSSARLRLFAMEMAHLFGKGARKEVSEEEYAVEHHRILMALEDWKNNRDPALEDPSHLVTEFPNARVKGPEDIVSSPAPGVLFRPPLFTSTILRCEWHSIVLMHNSQSVSEPSDETQGRLMEHASAICQIWETVQSWSQSPEGSLIILHPCLAIASLFVPRDTKHHMWMRRKFALLEGMGYISPISMRTRMAELFNDQTCLHWWLPNGEGFTPILKAIRNFADDRNATAALAQRDNVGQIRHVFSKMEIGQRADINMDTGSNSDQGGVKIENNSA
ncbi:adhesion and hyphal regulator 1 [Naviculisporaceae sp. PSN 640]